jgi:mRNA interferase HicA
MSDTGYWNVRGAEFIRLVERVGRQRGLAVRYVARRGKGSHGTLFFGDRFTIVRDPKDELKTGALHGMLRQLGLKLTDIQ